ncbi:MAG: 50S ribosomal protein L18e [Thermoplasmata archaeon]|jgi:large subunit ribosomal protein L18e|nr:MAG: 50S ribosomal protein L18e [Thermoplasmata archaeon]
MKKSNPQITELIDYLYESAEKHGADIWKAVAKKLEKPSRNWAEVNVEKIAKHLNEGETALVTGKVLGDGIASKMEVAAINFSEQARKKIEEAGGKCYSLREIVDKNPKGKGIRIIGG